MKSQLLHDIRGRSTQHGHKTCAYLTSLHTNMTGQLFYFYFVHMFISNKIIIGGQSSSDKGTLCGGNNVRQNTFQMSSQHLQNNFVWHCKDYVYVLSYQFCGIDLWDQNIRISFHSVGICLELIACKTSLVISSPNICANTKNFMEVIRTRGLELTNTANCFTNIIKSTWSQ